MKRRIKNKLNEMNDEEVCDWFLMVPSSLFVPPAIHR